MNLAPPPLLIEIPAHVVAPISVHCDCPFVTAKLDGEEGLFLLDSGAPDIFLNQAHLSPDVLYSQREMLGSTGAFHGSFTHLGELTFGGCRFSGHPVSAIEMGHLEEAFKVELKGIIGFRQLIQTDWLVDYQAHELHLWNMAEKKDFEVTASFKTQYRNHLPLLKVNIGGIDFQLLVDTGASVILFDRFQKAKIMQQVTDLDLHEAQGASPEQVVVEQGTLNGFRVGEHGFGPSEIHFSDIAQLQSRLGLFDGIIGAALLKSQKTLVSWMKREIWFLE